MSERDHWRNWTMEQWQNAVYCEDCGLPMLEVEDGQNHGYYLCPYCTWTSDEVDSLKAQNALLRAALTKIRDTSKSWEGRVKAPYWNLGDIAAAALLRGEG
jgi:hypothetical protein